MARFPYVNGDLFAKTLSIPEFDSDMRAALLDACRFDWTAISPAIFGTLFQSVMEPAEQRIKGSHYTSEANVLKVIEPLFLDDLRAEFERLKRSRGTRRNAELHAYRQRLGSLNFLDPACGCRNFLVIGSKPIDGGHYIFKPKERDAFLEKELRAEPFLRPYIGSREYLQGGERYILALHDAPPEVLSSLPHVRKRIASVRAYRSASRSRPTQALGLTPKLYHVNVLPTEPFLVVPKVSSERREYVPIGWLEPPTIPSDLVFVLQGATKPLFALLTSAMHMAWLRQIGGRLKSDYRYSIGLVYNTFPPPTVKPEALERLTPLADAVLKARAAHPGATLAEIYDPDLMPVDLRRAHRAIDRAVDRLYRPRRFDTERDRLEHLLTLYERMTAPISTTAKPKLGRRRRTRHPRR